MPKVNLLSKDWCNLVFENRNKEYGAYVLRRDGGAMLTRALVIVLVVFVFVAVLPLVLFKWQVDLARKEAMNTIANLSKLEPPKVKRMHELKAVDITQKMMAKRVKNSIKFVPEISEDENAESQLLLGVDEVGKSDDTKALVDVPDSLLTNDSALAGPRVSDACRVEVSFYVSKEGKVIEPSVTKKVHPLLDREAMLTVMKMPKWVPGRVKGKVSIVRVTIPIEFSCN